MYHSTSKSEFVREVRSYPLLYITLPCWQLLIMAAKGRPGEGDQCVGAACTTQPGTTDTNFQQMTVVVYIFYVINSIIVRLYNTVIITLYNTILIIIELHIIILCTIIVLDYVNT